MSNMKKYYLSLILIISFTIVLNQAPKIVYNINIDNIILNEGNKIEIENNTFNRTLTNEQLVNFNSSSTSIQIKNTIVSSNDIILSNNYLLTNVISNNSHINTYNLAKNFSQIHISNTTIKYKGDLIILDNSISIYLNDKSILFNDQLFLTSLFISNVNLHNGNVKIISNKFTHNILIENLIIQNGDLIIEDVFLFTGTIIIKQTQVINGRIIINNVSISKKVLIEKESVYASLGIFVCPKPFSSQLKSKKVNGCYIYYGVANTFNDAQRICNNMNAQVLKAYNRDILDDFPRFPNILNQKFYWVGARAQAAASKDFYWQDGSKVDSSFWCKGEPKGGSDNLCAYTSQNVLYSDQKCIKTGGCGNTWFDHGLICHYVYENN